MRPVQADPVPCPDRATWIQADPEELPIIDAPPLDARAGFPYLITNAGLLDYQDTAHALDAAKDSLYDCQADHDALPDTFDCPPCPQPSWWERYGGWLFGGAMGGLGLSLLIWGFTK